LEIRAEERKTGKREKSEKVKSTKNLGRTDKNGRNYRENGKERRKVYLIGLGVVKISEIR